MRHYKTKLWDYCNLPNEVKPMFDYAKDAEEVFFQFQGQWYCLEDFEPVGDNSWANGDLVNPIVNHHDSTVTFRTYLRPKVVFSILIQGEDAQDLDEGSIDELTHFAKKEGRNISLIRDNAFRSLQSPSDIIRYLRDGVGNEIFEHKDGSKELIIADFATDEEIRICVDAMDNAGISVDNDWRSFYQDQIPVEEK